MKYTAGILLLTAIIVTIYSSSVVYAQETDFAKLFETEEYQVACDSYDKTCNSPLKVKYQSNSSMLVGVDSGAMVLIGPGLDAIQKDGYKIQSIIPEDNSRYLVEKWIYLAKEA